jgi:hypothetical protein
MHSYIGKKVLITTDRWFYGTDGKQYRAVYGTLNGIHEAGKTLGFIPNRSHANWFIEIGNITIMGCQVLYIIQTDDKPNLGNASDWSNEKEEGVKLFDRPSAIFETE